MPEGPFLRRVVLKNYKSIAACNLELDALTILVGPNGSGKSNFLDALRLVSDSLRTTLDHALRDRGGMNEVRRRSSGHPTPFWRPPRVRAIGWSTRSLFVSRGCKKARRV